MVCQFDCVFKLNMDVVSDRTATISNEDPRFYSYDKTELNKTFDLQILLKRLNNEIITWHQPWYQQSNSYSRPLKESDEDQEDAYRTDKICKAESDVILQNWHQFVEVHNSPIVLLLKQHVWALMMLYGWMLLLF